MKTNIEFVRQNEVNDIFSFLDENVLRVYVRWRLEALHLILPQKLIKRTNVE